MNAKTITIATSVAALLLAAGCTNSDDEGTGSQGSNAEKIKCDGANDCKGLSECESVDGKSSCQGLNDCKGEGWISLTPEACEKAGGTPRTETTANVKCQGINECKGQSSCEGADHACAGQNECAGMGFVEVPTEGDCTEAGGTVI